MAHFENILLERRGTAAIVTINRPKVLNALNRQTMEELGAALTEVRNDPEIRAAILTGAGEKAFVAGADITELNRLTPLEAKEYTHAGQAVLDFIEAMPKPVIAAINGFALGGGCELAMACSLRLASENAKLGQPEVKLGIVPGYGGTQRLPRLVGRGLALELLLTGEMISAADALRIGLVNHVVPPSELLPRTLEIAERIGRNGPLAVQYAIEAVNRGMEMSLREGLYLEAALFALSCATEDKQEGTGAFLEKRPAHFRGR